MTELRRRLGQLKGHLTVSASSVLFVDVRKPAIHTEPRGDKWVNLREGSTRALSKHKTNAEAQVAGRARAMTDKVQGCASGSGSSRPITSARSRSTSSSSEGDLPPVGRMMRRHTASSNASFEPSRSRASSVPTGQRIPKPLPSTRASTRAATP